MLNIPNQWTYFENVVDHQVCCLRPVHLQMSGTSGFLTVDPLSDNQHLLKLGPSQLFDFLHHWHPFSVAWVQAWFFHFVSSGLFLEVEYVIEKRILLSFVFPRWTIVQAMEINNEKRHRKEKKTP